MSMAALRTPPPPSPEMAVHGQRCFGFVDIVVVLGDQGGKQTRKVAAKKRRVLQLKIEDYSRGIKRPIRAKALRPYAARTQRAGPRPRSTGMMGLTPEEFWELQDTVRELTAAGVYDQRPKTFGECKPGPCGFVSCRHHLKLEVDPLTGVVKDNWPGIDVDEMIETCSLRVADGVPEGQTTSLESVGAYLNITLEWARRIESEALNLMKRRMEKTKK